MNVKSCAMISGGCFGYILLFLGIPFYMLVQLQGETSVIECYLITATLSFLALTPYTYLITEKNIKRALLIGLCLSLPAPYVPFLLWHGSREPEYTPYTGCEARLYSVRAAGGRYYEKHGTFPEDIETLLPELYDWCDSGIADKGKVQEGLGDKCQNYLYKYCSEITLSLNEDNRLVVTGRAKDDKNSVIEVGPTYLSP